MKRFSHYLSSLLIIAAFGFYSCSDDETPASNTTITYENNVPDGTINVNYTVQVVPGNLFDEERAAGLANATVILTQNNETTTAVTDQAGIANFEGMKNGTVSGTVILDGFINADFTAVIDAGPINTDVEQIAYSSSTVTIFQRNAGVDGRIWGDYIFLGVDPPTITSEFTTRTSVYVVYAVEEDYPMGEGNGKLTNVTMEYTTFKQETASDGVVDMIELPGTIEGVLSASFFMEDNVIPDPTPGSNKVFLFNIQPIDNSQGIPLNLIPGSTYHLGDLQAFQKVD